MIGRVFAVLYVGTVAGLAAVGFASGTTAAILLATALALPSGAPALVGFYVAYGLLALVPGANPNESSGSESCSAGVCTSSSTGDLATWFQVATDAIGVIALTAAAVANVLLVRYALRRLRRGPSGSAAGGASSPGRPTQGDETTPTPPDPAGS